MKRAIALAAALMLAGCGASDPVTDAPPTPSVLHFGDAHTYVNGVTVTVGKPKPFEAKKEAIGARKFHYNLKFPVTIDNGSKSKFDPSLFSANAVSGGVPAEPVFDTGNGIDSPPTTGVLPHRSVRFFIAFGVLNPGDITMDVSPDVTYPTVTYQYGQ